MIKVSVLCPRDLTLNGYSAIGKIYLILYELEDLVGKRGDIDPF